MFCKYCGAQLDEDSVFCSKCGKQVKQTPIVAVLENPSHEESPSPVVDSSTTDNEEEKEAKPEEKSRKTETILERLLKDEKTSHSAELQFKIGQCYYNGTDGTTVNYEQAMKWFVKAAYQEHAKAQNNLGIMYENGYGTEKDLSLAKMWYKKAADHGIVFARISFEKLENDTNSHSQQNSYYQTNYFQQQAQPKKEIPSYISPKSRTIVAVLCFFLGYLGIHRFYVGKKGTGTILAIGTLVGWTLMFIPYIVIGVWVLIDLIVILCGNFQDSEGRTISNWDAAY